VTSGDAEAQFAAELAEAQAPDALQVVDQEADARFRALAQEMSLDPDDPWLGGYADYVWTRGRRIFATLPVSIAGRRVLEFGCNFGATSITLARLHARIVAVDVSEAYIALARVNAARYGVANAVDFRHVGDTTQLPFPDEHFDVITCCSVLEYVPHQLLGAVQRELDRVLRAGGIVVVTGTSNRLWPREVHSRQWLVNYLPRALDSLFPSTARERGVSPWKILRGFGSHYENLDRLDRGRAYLDAKRSAGDGAAKRVVLAAANPVLLAAGLSIGLVTPSISVRLRKTAATPESIDP
jgi:2-polyprenyl-3-methyl-5-hydroxy-6-metoxy-1,4-benzoquinol methylase